MAVPSGSPLSTFDPNTYAACWTEYFYGDCVPFLERRRAHCSRCRTGRLVEYVGIQVQDATRLSKATRPPAHPLDGAAPLQILHFALSLGSFADLRYAEKHPLPLQMRFINVSVLSHAAGCNTPE